MIGIFQLFFWFYALIFFAWLLRAFRALETVRKAPRVRPAASRSWGIYPTVSVIIPAKNEENNIQACLQGLLAQDYPWFEIIVINDNSSDKTEEILVSLGAGRAGEGEKPAGCGPLKYLNGTKTPPGWTGKNWAIHQAVSLAKGDWLLLTDADTRHAPSSISSSVRFALEKNACLLTLLPRCLTGSLAEEIVQPPVMGFMGLWFPVSAVNDPAKPVYFGNGQYFLIRKDVYQQAGGHEAVRGEFLEDFALFKKVKSSSQKALCAFGNEIYGTRMYETLPAIWKGWRRIYMHAFKRKTSVLLGKALSVFFFSVLPFILFIPLTSRAVSDPAVFGPAWFFAVAVLFFILGTAWKTHEIVGAGRIYCLWHPVACLILSAVLLDAAWTAFRGKQTVWR